MSFLDLEISWENGKFVTTFYSKPTFSGVYTPFESFLLSTHKFGMLYTLVYRRFTLCSDWTEFQRKLVTLKESLSAKVLPYLGPISLQVRTKIRNALKSTLNCCKL